MKRLLITLAILFLSAASYAQVGGPGTVIVGGGGTSAASGPATALQSPVVIEGTADAFEGNFTFADPTADWTWAWGATGDVTTPGKIVLGTNGDASNPSLTFAGHTNTGIFGHSSGGYFQFTVGGDTKGYFSSSGLSLIGANAGGAAFIGRGGYISGFGRLVEQNTAGTGAPNVLLGDDAASEVQKVLTNEGATAENFHTLPSAYAGATFTFIVQDADGIRITAAAGDTIRPIAGTAASAAAGFIRCATQGAFITLLAINATEWVSIGSAGVWTIDI